MSQGPYKPVPSLEDLEAEARRFSEVRDLAVTLENFRQAVLIGNRSFIKAVYQDILNATIDDPAIYEASLELHRYWHYAAPNYGCSNQ